MSRWWRAYDDALNDPKVQRLPGELFKTWFNLLCVASKHDGVLPDNETLAFMLRSDIEKIKIDLDQLTACGLIDRAGDRLQPHNWQGRQHKSDVSTERVQRFRERHTKRDETVSETPPERDRTETERADTRAVSLCKAIAKIYDTAGHLPPDTGRAYTWLAQNWDPKIIEAVIAERIRPGKPSKPLAYFEPIIADACAKKGEPPQADDASKERMYLTLLEREAETGVWDSARISKSDIPAAVVKKFQSRSISQSEGVGGL